MTDRLPTIAILGAGSMGGAILAGLLASGARDITVTNRSEASAAPLRQTGVVSLATETTPDANRAAVRTARIVLLGVKPAQVPDIVGEIADDLPPDAVVVSLAAGVTIARIEALVPNPVVRVMPNTPALVGLAVTGLAAGARVTAADVALVSALFATVGAVVEVPEAQIDALSTVSGSGPAYVFYLIEQLTATARNLGFDEATARVLVEQTFRGASELLAASDVPPAELRRRVTSPGGTTERAIAELEAAELTGLFDRATASALARARELAAE
ncbi:MAG TPA: pyrroline-5-carboxylate reductase [Pseudolysinimonas sp.]|nr:pyrroline-5-carboxylate reductase [Pseudolysinimonas sp.]